MSAPVDWSKETCPDCRGKRLVEGMYDSDQIDDGYTIFCEGCGFEIAGRDEHMVQSAVLVLKRWGVA